MPGLAPEPRFGEGGVGAGGGGSFLAGGALDLASGKESACQGRRRTRHGFDPWVRKIPPEKEMVPHSSILAWEASWTEQPGGLQSMRSQKGGRDRARMHTAPGQRERPGLIQQWPEASLPQPAPPDDTHIQGRWS